jgi:fibronectin type 3 domain-containing protein
MRRIVFALTLVLAGCGSNAAAPQKPPTPGGLTATVSGLSVQLSWSASAGASGYVVLRGATSAGQFASIATPTATSYTDTGLAAGTTYFYEVEATNSAGASDASVAVSATTATAQSAPGAPASLTATASAAGVSLSWPVVSGATAYLVLRGTAAAASRERRSPP